MERECDKMKAESQNSQKRRGAPFQRRQRMSQLSNIKNVKEICTVTALLFPKNSVKILLSIRRFAHGLQNWRAPARYRRAGNWPRTWVLTWELAARARKVVAVELDERLLPVLGETLAGFDNVKVIQADVLKIDLDALLRQEFPQHGSGHLRKPALLYYLSHCHAPARDAAAGQSDYRDGAKKSSRPYLCSAGQPQCRRTQRSSQLLCSSSNSVSGLPRQFYACAGGGFGCDSAGYSAAARRIPPWTKRCFQGDPAGFSQRRKTLSNSLSSGLSLAKDQTSAALQQVVSPIRSGGGIDAGRFLPADVADF